MRGCPRARRLGDRVKYLADVTGQTSTVPLSLADPAPVDAWVELGPAGDRLWCGSTADLGAEKREANDKEAMAARDFVTHPGELARVHEPDLVATVERVSLFDRQVKRRPRSVRRFSCAAF